MKYYVLLFAMFVMIVGGASINYAGSSGYWFDSSEKYGCDDYVDIFSDLSTKGEYEEVVKGVNVLLSKGDNYSVYFRFAGEASYCLGRYREAAAFFEKALNSRAYCYPFPSERVFDREKSTLNYLIGESLRYNNDDERSKYHYKEAVKLYKKSFGANFDEVKMDSFFKKSLPRK